MSTVFGDTFYFLALLNRRDRTHHRAIQYNAGFQGNLVTTGWILTELADALADPGNRSVAVQTINQLRQDPQIVIVDCDRSLFEAGLILYTNRLDKEWSLTDCISFVVMQQHGMTEALTGDHHFEQAGFVALLK